tara:strand:- start:239 stop:1054 length:816 start_codon:yes stop_codon:yes gene_type:complete
MSNLKIFCLCIHNELLEKVKKLNYIPVGLGEINYQKGWLRDNIGKNISHKNKFYGEYTFHYWLWQNEMNTFNGNDWVGFCAYRRFWLNEKEISNSELPFRSKILRQVPEIWNNYDVILGNKVNMNNIKPIKIIKYGKLAILNNPKSFFKKNRNIKFHFDMFHGIGVLDKAIDLLNIKDREDFREFVNINDSFNPANLFICRSKSLIEKYYQTIFEWFKECEKIFGFDLKGYGQMRIYGFLAERFLPFWFNKYAKCLEWPIIFNDLRDENLV